MPTVTIRPPESEVALHIDYCVDQPVSVLLTLSAPEQPARLLVLDRPSLEGTITILERVRRAMEE